MCVHPIMTAFDLATQLHLATRDHANTFHVVLRPIKMKWITTLVKWC